MRRWLALLAAVAAPAFAQVEIRNAWSRETPPGATIGVGFMEIRNRGPAPDRLMAVSTPLAGRVEIHVTRREGDVIKMRQVGPLEIPAGERIELRPGGAHLMLVDLKRALKKGERLPMTLRFERSGERQIELEVQEIGARYPRH